MEIDDAGIGVTFREVQGYALIIASKGTSEQMRGQILSLACSTAYYRPQETNETAMALMRRIDELHLEYPFAGSPMLRGML